MGSSPHKLRDLLPGGGLSQSLRSVYSSPDGLRKVNVTKIITATTVADEQSGHDLESQHTGRRITGLKLVCVYSKNLEKQTKKLPPSHT